LRAAKKPSFRNGRWAWAWSQAAAPWLGFPISSAGTSPSTRIAKFDTWAIAQTKLLVNAGLPPDVELGAGWDACIGSLGRPAAQNGIKALMALGFHKPGDVENRLGYYLGQTVR
jgi:hypothetical protein